MSPFYKNEYLIEDRFMVTRFKTEHLAQALIVLTAQVVLFTLILMIFVQIEMLPPGCWD